MSRKQVLANLGKLVAEADTTGPQDVEGPEARKPAPVRPLLGTPTLAQVVGAAPVGALGKSLHELTDRSKRAEEIEKQLMSGETIIKLDPNTIEPSIIPDRMASNDQKFDSLVESMRENGQKVPILVRPHPDKPDRYQTAYGYRRTQAALLLGREVDAIVRKLSDEDLIKAQGQENNERKDLSYIEKARWAHRLAKRFPRDFVMSALSVHKSDLSNMLAVVDKIPDDVIDAIGPASDAGRRPWMLLADRLEQPNALPKVQNEVGKDDFEKLPSTERLQCVLGILKTASQQEDAEILVSGTGGELGRIVRSKRKVTISVDRRTSPDFAEYITQQLQRLAREYGQRQQVE